MTRVLDPCKHQHLCKQLVPHRLLLVYRCQLLCSLDLNCKLGMLSYIAAGTEFIV